MSSKLLDRLVKFLVAKKERPIPEVFEALEREEPKPESAQFNGSSFNPEAGMISVNEMKVGSSGEIVSLSPHQNGRMERLLALGIIAGNKIEVVQKQPSLVIKVDHTEIALDKEIAGGIFIRNEGQ